MHRGNVFPSLFRRAKSRLLSAPVAPAHSSITSECAIPVHRDRADHEIDFPVHPSPNHQPITRASGVHQKQSLLPSGSTRRSIPYLPHDWWSLNGHRHRDQDLRLPNSVDGPHSEKLLLQAEFYHQLSSFRHWEPNAVWSSRRSNYKAVPLHQADFLPPLANEIYHPHRWLPGHPPYSQMPPGFSVDFLVKTSPA